MLPPNRVVATVDDDRRVRESVQSILESAGYDAVAFGSGEAFLESGALSRVACVVADVRLPGIDGLELQRRARRDRPSVPMNRRSTFSSKISQTTRGALPALAPNARRALVLYTPC